MDSPYIIDFFTSGSSESGFISVAEVPAHIPFTVKRTYWIYGGDTDLIRGNHAYKKGDQIIIAFCGVIEVCLESPDGKVFNYVLDSPSKGLLIPGPYWRRVNMPKGAVLYSLSSMEYDEQNYVRDYSLFQKNKAGAV